MSDKRVICWFSCGAASAVATKLTLKDFPEAEIIYQDTGSEHPDNVRFKAQCEMWYGRTVKVLKSEKYADIWDVYKKTEFLVNPYGARCTTELKRRVAEQYINVGDVEILGYTSEEEHRVKRFEKANPERILSTPLIEKELTKNDCLALIQSAGIELPAMYRLGYKNNNCIGCVKGQAGYWNKIRVDFPKVFARMAKVERKLDVAINKKYRKALKGEKADSRGRFRERVFLDELPATMGNYAKEPSMSCGVFCSSAKGDM